MVDNVGDVVDETGGNGTDIVLSSISFSLADPVHAIGDIENLTLTGTKAINGAGNGLNNIITGNSDANTLTGGAGVDTLIGGLGDDTYALSGGKDTVSDSGGIDTITSIVNRSLASYATIENLTLLGSSAINGTGNALNNTITGNGAANVMNGGAGTDTLIGGLGKDTLTGGLNADSFDFNALDESVVGANRDLVQDFNRTQGDKIDLSTIDADTDGTAGNQAFSFIGTAAFTGVDGQLRASDNIIQGDVNGDMVADFEIHSNLATHIASDFIF